MSIAAAAFALMAISLTAVHMGAEDRAAGLKELADAERAFAKLSLAKGVAHSFHENFADDGIGFSPEPVKVKAEMAKRPPQTTRAPRQDARRARAPDRRRDRTCASLRRS